MMARALALALFWAVAAATAFAQELTIAPVPTDLPRYDRAEFRAWIDADGDCQDTRAEVLIDESLEPVAFRADRQCTIATGRWIDPYTGNEYNNASQLDIDHLVPLSNAFRSGAWAWDGPQKREFGNYLADPWHLIAVSASANRSKGDSGPEEWRPTNQGYWCDYAHEWITVKQAWSLTATEAEWAALVDMLTTCPIAVDDAAPADPVMVVEQPSEVPPPAPVAAPVVIEPTVRPIPTTIPAPVAAGPTVAPSGYDTARYLGQGDRYNCGDFTSQAYAQAVLRADPSDPNKLDTERDGIACESRPNPRDLVRVPR